MNELGFTIDAIDHLKAMQLWAELLLPVYQHEDWTQLVAFFDKRYSKREMLSDRAGRRLQAPADGFYNAGKSMTVNFLTDPSAVGMPADFTVKLAEVVKKSRGSLIGADPKGTSIAPALSIAFGATAYMDLIYGGEEPFHQRPIAAVAVEADGVATTRKGGRKRTAAEWRALWARIADWVYEYDATSLVHHFLSSHTYQYRLSDAEMAECHMGQKVPRKYLKTEAIEGADGLRDTFAQIAEDPTRFHGIEWDFLKLQVSSEVEQAFYARFGAAPASRAAARPSLLVRIPSQHMLKGYGDVPAECVKACPNGYAGAEWEKWLLSVRGGDVLVVGNLFQVSCPAPILGLCMLTGLLLRRRSGPFLCSHSGLSSSRFSRKGRRCRCTGTRCTCICDRCLGASVLPT